MNMGSEIGGVGVNGPLQYAWSPLQKNSIIATGGSRRITRTSKRRTTHKRTTHKRTTHKRTTKRRTTKSRRRMAMRKRA